MPKQLNISGATGARNITGMDVEARAMGTVGTALTGLGTNIAATQANNRRNEMISDAKVAKLAAVAKGAKDKAITDLYEAELDERVKTFNTSLTNMPNEKDRRKALDAFKSNEARILKDPAFSETQSSVGLAWNTKRAEVDGIFNRKGIEADAKEASLATENLINLKIKQGDVVGASKVIGEGVETNVFSPQQGIEKTQEAMTKVQKGSAQFKIATSRQTEDLDEVAGDLESGDGYGLLSEGERASLMVEAENKAIAIIQKQNATAAQTALEGIRTSTITLEDIDNNPNLAPDDRISLSKQLAYRLDIQRGKISKDERAEFTKRFHKYQQGGWFTDGGNVKALEDIYEYLDEIKAGSDIYNEINEAIIEDKMGDNALSFWGIDKKKVKTKYPKYLADNMTNFDSKFAEYTSYMTPRARAIAYNDVYQTHIDNVKEGFKEYGMRIIQQTSGKIKRTEEAFIAEDLEGVQNSYQLRMDINRVIEQTGVPTTPTEKVNAPLYEGADIEFEGSYEDDAIEFMRYVMIRRDLSETQAYQMYKNRTRK